MLQSGTPTCASLAIPGAKANTPRSIITAAWNSQRCPPCYVHSTGQHTKTQPAHSYTRFCQHCRPPC
eukprot:418692-Pelagomonas_calceolata.AAC.6